jgi:hypothetical protein
MVPGPTPGHKDDIYYIVMILNCFLSSMYTHEHFKRAAENLTDTPLMDGSIAV